MAWWFLENRTTKSYCRFFFLFKHHPEVKTFTGDRHHAEPSDQSCPYGEAHVLCCCVHLARNIGKNTGSNSTLTSLFWKMRYERSVVSETAFLNHLDRMHPSNKSMFSSHPPNSTESFFPSVIDNLLKRKPSSPFQWSKHLTFLPSSSTQKPNTMHSRPSRFSNGKIQSRGIFSLVIIPTALKAISMW